MFTLEAESSKSLSFIALCLTILAVIFLAKRDSNRLSFFFFFFFFLVNHRTEASIHCNLFRDDPTPAVDSINVPLTFGVEQMCMYSKGRVMVMGTDDSADAPSSMYIHTYDSRKTHPSQPQQGMIIQSLQNH